MPSAAPHDDRAAAVLQEVDNPGGSALLDALVRLRWARANGKVERVLVCRQTAAEPLCVEVRSLQLCLRRGSGPERPRVCATQNAASVHGSHPHSAAP
jgi:hypothetical protein